MKKGQRANHRGVPYARGFDPPTAEEAWAAAGDFPCRIATDRLKHQPRGYERPSLVHLPAGGGGGAAEDSASASAAEAEDDFNCEEYFRDGEHESSTVNKKQQQKGGSSSSKSKSKSSSSKSSSSTKLFPLLAPPERPEDWLAQVVEEGQSFEEYVDFVATRSGRFKRWRQRRHV